jgi:hypothetical protein
MVKFDKASDAIKEYLSSGERELKCEINGIASTVYSEKGRYGIRFEHEHGWEWPREEKWKEVADKHDIERVNLFFYPKGNKSILAEVQNEFLEISADYAKALELTDDLFALYLDGVEKSKHRGFNDNGQSHDTSKIVSLGEKKIPGNPGSSWYPDSRDTDAKEPRFL